MENQHKKQYASPVIIEHQRIEFETSLSGSCAGGHWEFVPSDDGLFWKRVCVKDTTA